MDQFLSPRAAPAFADGEQPDRRSVTTSWERCLVEHGLSREKVQRPAVLTAVEIQDRREPIADLLALSQGEVQRLFELLSAQDYVVMFSDPGGVALGFRSTESVLNACSSTGVLPGSMWAEEMQGTNGIGLCIREQRPLSVVMQDHFDSRFSHVSCTVAPVFGEAGAFAGVLNVTTLRTSDRADQAVVRQVVAAAARRIENLYFDRRHARHAILRLSRHGEFSDTALETRVALDASGRVLDATPTAQRVLDPTGAALVGRSLADIQGMQWELLQDRCDIGIELPSGRHYVRLEEPPQKHIFPLKTPRAATPRPSEIERPLVDEIIGDDPVVREAVAVARRLVAHRVPVFLHGETGTGKSALARALHLDAGGSPDKFVAINCAAITSELIESELFGYRPGAFTGASRQGARGRLLEADGGTLFLDEIGDMPMGLQTRLLQVLSDGEFTPVGATQSVQVRFALIAASLHDIAELVSEGTFREDLYFRLAGATVRLPPLRTRNDRHLLIERAFASAARRVGERCPVIEDPARRALDRYDWPGNLRELQHTARYAIAVDTNGRIGLADLPLPLSAGGAAATPATASRDRRMRIEAALERSKWNVSTAAALLGISRATLHRHLRALGIDRPN